VYPTPRETPALETAVARQICYAPDLSGFVHSYWRGWGTFARLAVLGDQR
jgi:hypothetical protein